MLNGILNSLGMQAQAAYAAQNGFSKMYKCRSVVYHKPEMEAGGKICLPASALQLLSQLNIEYPMLFELENPDTQQHTHCGVLEFTAPEGFVFVPSWMMQYLFVAEGSFLKVRNVTLPRATYVKLQPHQTAFIEIANPKAVLEMAFRNFSCLTVGEVIRIQYNQASFDINVLEVKPDQFGAVSIVETDVQLDFAAPVDYVEPAPAPAAKRQRSDSNNINNSATAATVADSVATNSSTSTSSLANDNNKSLVFSGVGRTLSGKPAANHSVGVVTSSSRASSTSSSAAANRKQTKIILVKGVLTEVPIDAVANNDSDDSDDDSDDSSSSDAAVQGGLKLNGNNTSSVNNADDDDDSNDGFKPFAGAGNVLRAKKK